MGLRCWVGPIACIGCSCKRAPSVATPIWPGAASWPAKYAAQQLELALALLPDLVSVVTGGNDILKGYWNGPHYEAEIAAMLEELTATGATVLTATIPDIASNRGNWTQWLL